MFILLAFLPFILTVGGGIPGAGAPPTSTPKPCDLISCAPGKYCDPDICVPECQFPLKITCADIECACGYFCRMVNKKYGNQTSFKCPQVPMCLPSTTLQTCSNKNPPCMPGSICMMAYGNISCWPKPTCVPFFFDPAPGPGDVDGDA